MNEAHAVCLSQGQTHLPQQMDGTPTYRIWMDNSYAGYLWDMLEQISGELGGRVVGAAAVLTELA